MTGHDAAEAATCSGPDPDVVASLWLAEDHQAQSLATIRDQLDNEAQADWLDDAKAKERTRQRLEAIRHQRQATQPPPPTRPPAAAEPQHVQVHHSFDPQTHERRSAAPGLYLAGRIIGFLIPIVVILGAFIILIASALLIDKPTTPQQRGRDAVAESEWTCDDADNVEALTIDDDGVLWHWITPIGPCEELGR